MSREAKLIIETGPNRGRDVNIAVGGSVKIGRSSSNDVSLSDLSVSRFHCSILCKPNGSLWLADMGSSNETLVNGKPARNSRLQVGDRVAVGESEFKVVADARSGAMRGMVRNPARVALGLVVLLLLAVVVMRLPGRGNAPKRPGSGGWVGETCSINVLTEPDNCGVSVDEMLVGDGPIVVKLAPGMHLVTASKVGFLSASKTVRLASGETNVMVSLSLEPIVAGLTVTTQPVGATVSINGEAHGESPLSVPNVKGGDYVVVATMPGFLSARETVSITTSTTYEVDMVLESTSGIITVRSDPSGATVTIGGTARGSTPCELAGVAVGVVEVSLSLKGYRDYAKMIRVRTGKDVEIDAKLSASSRALEIDSVPPQATVYIDGAKRGTTPVSIDDLILGERKLRVELAGYAPFEKNVTIEAGVPQRETLVLRKAFGSFEVTTSPPRVTIMVDGRLRGVTRGKVGEPTLPSQPYTLERLSTGTHEIRLAKDRYEDMLIQVEVKADDTVKRSVELTRRFVHDIVVHTGSGAAAAHTGMLDRRYENGDVRVELKQGIYRLFRKAEITSVEPYTAGEGPK